jgi:ATP-dependent phosphofructokinase / diphosphate-dependent phosphofructokinase
MLVGMLTGGGDCPGLNAVMRAVVRKAERTYGDQVLGFIDGWKGVLEGDTRALDVEALRGSLARGGTLIGSSRTNPFTIEGGVQQVSAVIDELGLDALIAIGGDDTLGVADRLNGLGIHTVGVPKTIDNDLNGTELTFGFDTAVQIATEAIDRLQSTSRSHHRVMVVEVMGRHAGHIATWSGLAGGAAVILIPEEPYDVDEVCAALERRSQLGTLASIVVVAEGAKPIDGQEVLVSDQTDAFGHARLGGVAERLADQIGDRTGFETRATVLGHVQRGGTPTAFDRVLATRFGIAAIDAVHDGAFGMMVALRAGEIVRVPIAEAVGSPKLVDPALYHGVAEVFFGG